MEKFARNVFRVKCEESYVKDLQDERDIGYASKPQTTYMCIDFIDFIVISWLGKTWCPKEDYTSADGRYPSCMLS